MQIETQSRLRIIRARATSFNPGQSGLRQDGRLHLGRHRRAQRRANVVASRRFLRRREESTFDRSDRSDVGQSLHFKRFRCEQVIDFKLKGADPIKKFQH